MNESTNGPSKTPRSFPVIFFRSSVMILFISLLITFWPRLNFWFHMLRQSWQIWSFPKVIESAKYLSLPSDAASMLLAPAAAGTVTVMHGIEEFQAKALSMNGYTIYIPAFLSLVLLFVLIPTSLVFIMKKITEQTVSFKSRVGTFVIVVFALIFPALCISFSVASNSLFATMNKENVVSEYRDNVGHALLVISYSTQQHFITPVNEGGGGGSFLKNNKPLTLNDLGFQENTPLGKFILFQQKSDTTLHLLFFGNKQGTLTSGYNPNITHVVEYDVAIYPSSFKITTVN